MTRLPLLVGIWSSWAACATAGVETDTETAPDASASTANAAAAPKMRVVFTILSPNVERKRPGPGGRGTKQAPGAEYKPRGAHSPRAGGGVRREAGGW